MSEWIAITITALLALTSAVYSLGYNKRRIDEMDKIIDRFEDSHASHYEAINDHERKDNLHFRDTEVHWSARERDELRHTLDRIERGIDTLMTRSRERRNNDA